MKKSSDEMLIAHFNIQKAARKANGRRKAIPQKIRYRVLEKAQGRCQLCGRTVEEHGVVMTIDHIIPVSRGGTNEEHNLRALCMACNQAKGAEVPESCDESDDSEGE